MFNLTLWLIFGLVLKRLFSNRMERLNFLWQPGGALLFHKETTEQMFSTLIHSSCGKNFFLYIHALSIGYIKLFYLQYLGRIFSEQSGNNICKYKKIASFAVGGTERPVRNHLGFIPNQAECACDLELGSYSFLKRRLSLWNEQKIAYLFTQGKNSFLRGRWLSGLGQLCSLVLDILR